MSFHSWLASLNSRFLTASAPRNNRRTRRSALVLEALESRLAPATLVVNTNAVVLNPSQLTQPEAINAVNAGNSNGLTAGAKAQVSGTFGVNDTIEFSSTLSGDTITLNGTALPELAKSMTISGPGAGNLAISGNNQSGVFDVAGSTTVSISGLTIADGSSNQGGGIDNAGVLTVTNSTVTGNDAPDLDGRGGGIDNAGVLTVTNSTVTGNETSGVDSGGGGIFNGPTSTVTVTNSTVTGNSASFGGGIANENMLTVTNSTVTDNSAEQGGGIYSDFTLTVTNSTVAGNEATDSSGDGEGGGISNDGTLTVTNSAVTGNSANIGGGIYNAGYLTVTNSTIAGNLASDGGGIEKEEGTLTVTNSTIAGNQAPDGDGAGIDIAFGSATLNNTIVADMASSTDLFGNGFSGSYDLIGDGSDLSSFSHSLQGNPLLAPLGNYGGPTQTLPLLPGSPALDAGSVLLAVDPTGNSLTTDQRGQPRLVNGAVDIGAFQSQGFTVTASGSNQTTFLNAAFAQPLVVTVTANNAAEPVDGGVVTFTLPTSGASATLSTDHPPISAGQVSVPAQANGSAGSYTITASIAGTSTPVSFALTNEAVAINAITPQTVADGSPLSVTITARSFDGSPLTYSLGANALAGAAITSQGVFTWTPSESNGIAPGSYSITVMVADANNPQYNGSVSFTVTVGPSSTNQGSGMAARQTVALGLTQSAEYYTDFITAAYEQYLGRAPDATGLAYWLNQMQNQGLSDGQLEAGFLSSQEDLNDHGGANASWIEGLYTTFLDRTPASSEVQYWVNQLANGMTPMEVALGFTTSQEHESDLVAVDYQQYLGRSASTSEIQYWVNVFESGTSNEQVIAGFVSSQEYFQDHGNNIVDWLYAAYRTALNREPDATGYQYWESQLQ